MSATALLAGKPDPSDADIDAAMLPVISAAAGTYHRIRAAIKKAAHTCMFQPTSTRREFPQDRGRGGSTLLLGFHLPLAAARANTETAAPSLRRMPSFVSTNKAS